MSHRPPLLLRAGCDIAALCRPLFASATPRQLETMVHTGNYDWKLRFIVCPERKVKRCRKSFCDSCCASDGGRSSGLAVQAGSPNRPDVLSVKNRGGKRLRKRLAVSGSGVRREDEHG